MIELHACLLEHISSMIVLIFLLIVTLNVVSVLLIPKHVLTSMVHPPWIRSSNFSSSPCTAVDGYVRGFTRELIVLLVGDCDNLLKRRVVCDIEFDGATRSTNVLASVTQAYAGGTRAGETRTIFESGGGPVVRIVNQFCVRCGQVRASGRVTLLFGSAIIASIPFVYTPLPLTPTGATVCTRVYDFKGWTPFITLMFIEWLEWQWVIGFDTVHVYVNSLDVSTVWDVLYAHAKTGRVILYQWSDGTKNDIVQRAWALAQMTHIADCLLRLEGRVRYIMPIDMDEFVQASRTTNVPQLLDKRYAQHPNASGVTLFDPFTVRPDSCHTATASIHVSTFCRGYVDEFKRRKYILRPTPTSLVQIHPRTHIATDDVQQTILPQSVLRTLHLGRSLGLEQKHGGEVATPWNETISHSVWQAAVTREPPLAAIYSDLVKFASNATRRAAQLALTLQA